MKLRFQQPSHNTYVRAISNQVGPDVSGVTTKRADMPTFTDDNTRYVAKTGNDGNAGTSAAPKLTIQAACNQSIFFGGSTLYDENADLTELSVQFSFALTLNQLVGWHIYFEDDNEGPLDIVITGNTVTDGSLIATIYFAQTLFSSNYNDDSYSLENCTASVNVAIKDDGVYEEIVDAKHRPIYALADHHPTIKYPSSNPEAYAADAGEILELAAGSYYLRGLVGTSFYNTINDYQIFDGRHWIASTNGLWYSAIGYVGWRQVPGTSGMTFDDLVFFNGNVYARRYTAGQGVYLVTKSSVSLFLSCTTGIGLIACGDVFMALVTTEGYGVIRYYYAGAWGVSGDIATGVYKAPFSGSCVAAYSTIGSAFGLLVSLPDDAGKASRIVVCTPNEETGAMTFFMDQTLRDHEYELVHHFGYYNAVSDCFYFAETTRHAIRRIKGDGSASVGAFIQTMASDPLYSKAISSRVYYSMAGSVGYTDDDFANVDAIATTTGQTAVTVFDADIGRVIIGSTFGSANPGLFLWKQFVVNAMQHVNGIIIDGDNRARTGVYASFSNGEQNIVRYCDVKNCTSVGILDGGIDGQRAHISNTIVSYCGTGIKEPDFTASLLRFYYSYLHHNQIGVSCIGYDSQYGPEFYNCVIAENALAGVWYECLGSAYNPIVVNCYNSILYWNGIDLRIKNRLVASSVNVIYSNVIGTFDLDSHIAFTAYSQADPLLLSNGDYQDLAGGYFYDSIAKTIGAGIFTITRTPTVVAGIDHHLDYYPQTKAISWQPSNFQANENAYGEYSESWNGLKRRIVLNWPENFFSTVIELFKYLDLIRQEDAVFRFGDSDGVNWVGQLSGACTVAGSVVTVTAVSRDVGKNEFENWWIKIGTTYYKIASHPQEPEEDSLAITVIGTPGSSETAFSIDYLLVKIDKSSAFGGSQIGYPVGINPLTGYQVTLREVDDE